MNDQSCILCDCRDIHNFFEDTTKAYSSDYCRCPNCQLIFAPPKDRPSKKEEFEHYQTHENNPEDEGYRNFLRQLFDPLNSKLEPDCSGLDFGSGPGPTLNLMFEEAGHEVQIYDPFYADDKSVFEKQYDFITATEVVEHLFEPGEELKRLLNCLRPGGYLGIMTKIAVDNKKEFAGWHYRKDLTHVTFYTKGTFKWLADKWDATITFHGNRVIIFQKPANHYAKKK